MPGRDSSRPQSRAATTAALLLVVLLGAAAWIANAGGARSGAVSVPAAGRFWSVRDGDDHVLDLRVDGVGLELRPGQVFWLQDEAEDTRLYTDLSFRLGPGEGQSAYTDLRLGDRGARNFRFVFLPSQPPAGYIATRVGQGRWTELARGHVAAAPETGADPRAPYELRVRLLPDAIEATWNGLPLVRATTPVAPASPRVALWADDARLLSVRVSGTSAVGRDFELADDFASLQDSAQRRRRLHAALALAAAFVLVALYLRSRCTRRPPAQSLLHASLLWLAPASLPVLLDALHPLPGLDPRVAAAALALPGLLLALWSLREFGPLGVAARGATTAGPAAGLAPVTSSVARSAAPRRVADGVRATLVVLALVGATAFAASGAAGARADRALRDSQRWLPFLDARSFALDAPLALDAGNALPIPGLRRDFDLSARLTLSPDALLELRLRSPDDQAVAGLALCLRAGDAPGGGVFLENNYEFRRLASLEAPVPAGTPFELQVRLRDTQLEASVDGRRIARAESDEFPAGEGFVLAAAGRAQIERLELQPVADGGSLPRPGRERAVTALGVALGACGLLLLLALLARGLLGQPLPAALESLAFVLAPLAMGWAATDAEGRVSLTAAGAACAGAGLLLLVHAPSLGLPARAARKVLFVLVAIAACAGALLLALDPSTRGRPVDAVRPYVFPGPRLPVDLVAFEHPALRRLNGWLREHRFRGKSVDMEKPAGTLRVVAVGSSSTWGHGVPEESGLDYPTQLQALLAEALPGVPVEVINGGVPGSSSASALRFFREVLLRFQPDVVTVCFAFNDAYHVTQLDEDRFLERITQPDYDHALSEEAEADEALLGKQRLNRLLQLFAAHPGPTLPLWKGVLAEMPGPVGTESADARTPPERFASNLRAYARLCAERGVALVLIKEPFRDDVPRIWKDEFYAAIDAVAAEFGLAVLDPRPALAAGGAALFLDEIHPAPAGHAIIGRELLPLVQPLLQGRVEGQPGAGRQR